MPTPITGAISMSQMRDEVGATGQFSMGDARARRLMMETLGNGDAYLSIAPKMSKARATKYVKAGTTESNVVLTTVFGNPTIATNYRMIIPPTAQVVGTGWALIVGQFPSTSVVDIINWGNILGSSGSIGQGVTGGYGVDGGSCIYASYTNVTHRIWNKPGGQIFGGGGGGGKGGNGGRGGDGGQGVYQITNQEGPSVEPTTNGVYRFSTGSTYWKWHAPGTAYQNYFSTAGDGTNQVNDGPYRYYRYTMDALLYDAVFGYYNAYSIYRQWETNVYTAGGSGGSGGGGGDGGFGQGWDRNASGPTNGGLTGGSGGGGPQGPNAGYGGTGGRGGDGGNGGGWGQSGSYGQTGWTGAAGSGGNWTGGNPGSGGNGGYPPGAAGYWLVLNGRGSASNEGDARGRVAA